MAEAKEEAKEAENGETKESPQAPEQNVEEKTLEGGFKSVGELETAYKDLQSKLGTQGDELGQLRDFQNQAYPIIDAVYGDQNLMKDVRQAVESKYGVGNSDQAVPQNQPDTYDALGSFATIPQCLGRTAPQSSIPVETKLSPHCSTEASR